MTKKTNTAPEVKEGFWIKHYNNFNVGVLSMVVSLGLPFILPFLGSFLAPVLYLGGVVALFMSKKPIWLRVLVVLVLTVPLIIWWQWYAYAVFLFTDSFNRPTA